MEQFAYDEMRAEINYLFSKINWGQSFLDARAIRAMNTDFVSILEQRIKELEAERGEVVAEFHDKQALFEWIRDVDFDLDDNKVLIVEKPND